MSLSTTVLPNQGGQELFEKVMLGNDLGGLTPIQKVQHVSNICNSLGLNPLTKPIQLLKFQGREIPYVTRDGCDQLRKINNISIPKLETKTLDGVYIVTAYARDVNGREDSSTGAIAIKGLVGDALCNAFMKCESKAKRRVTLSICGLGLTEESELDTIKGHQKFDHASIEQDHNVETGEIELLPVKPTLSEEKYFSDTLELMDKAKDQEFLKDLFTKAYRSLKKYPDMSSDLISVKDKNKARIDMEQEIAQPETSDEQA